ncbi:MAG: hypothetical protein Q9160_001892 [Pyrenula sp. 1 TL-2023]
MDQPSNSSHPQSHQQFSEGNPPYDNLFAGISEYASLDQNEDPNYDFLWENNTNFPQSDQQHSYTPQNTTGWGHNQISSSNEPALPQYESLRQQPNETNAYSQPMYGVRPASQNQFDARSFSRPSHSPTPYNAYAYQQPMTFNTAPNYASSNEFAVQPPHTGARRSPMPQSAFQSDLGQPQYVPPYGIRQTLHPGFQTMQMGRYGDQADQERRQATNVVDPRFLNPTDFQTSQLDQMQSQFQNVPEILPNANSATGIHQRIPVPQGSMPTPPIAQKSAPSIMKIDRNATTKPRSKKDPNAPKRPRGRPRKDGAGALKDEGSPTGSTDDSDSDDLVIEQAPEPMPGILIPPRPDQVDQKIIYEACLAVWSPRNLAVPAKKVSDAVKSIGDLLKGLRDQWKKQNELLKQAEIAGSPATASLKADVARLRQQAGAVASKVAEYGHPSLLPHLGNNPYTLSALQSFLLDRVHAGDNDGPLVINILKLMNSFTSVTTDLLAKTKNDKILLRLTKKAGPEAKKLSQIVLDNASAAEKRRAGSTTPPSGEQLANLTHHKNAIPQVVIDRSAEPITGTKRSSDQSNLPASKRPVVPPKTVPQASKPLALQNATSKRPDSSQQKPTMPIINGVTTSTGGKPKPPATTAMPKPATNIFSALSAAKKPGTSNAARAAAAKEKALNGLRAEAKKESSPPSTPAARASSVSQPAFSFAQTLAGLNKPKEAEEKKEEDHPQETEEERAKRLRKEARKKLRVSWKPDASLTDVRIFEHHPDEEIGRADSMRRDIDDVGGEGRMLKKHKEMDDLDEDEESRANGEDLAPYSPPTEISYSFDPDPDASGNFVKRGGSNIPSSPEREAQDRREETTLMVVYTSPSDAPPTPKEPATAGDDEDDYSPPTAFGDPTDQSGVRARESKFYSSMAPRSQTPNSNELPSTQPNMSSILDIVGRLTQQRGQSLQQQPQQSFGALPQGWNNFIQQPQQQPQQQNNTQPDFNQLLSLVQQSQNQQQSHSAQPPPQPSQPAVPANNNLAAMLASLQSQGGQGQQQSGFGYNSANTNAYSGNIDGLAGALGVGNYDANNGGNENGDSAAWRKKKGGSNIDLGKSHPKAKTVACRYWKEGKCKKGDDCTFKHDDD